ncbi:MAG: deoxyribose-phosphate aldolase [Bacteroidota bacterium]
MKLAAFLDHTILKPDTTTADVVRICAEAKTHGFAAVCVPPFYVTQAKQELQGQDVKLATVIGFPLGYAATFSKVEEIKRAIDEGADEFDVVINIAAAKNANWTFVRNEIDRVIAACRMRAKTVKIILETGLLTEEEVRRLCDICNEFEPDFVKTSTGFNGPGASLVAVELLRSCLKKDIKIKASGGIRDAATAQAMIDAGADRIGASASVAIVQG